MTHIGLDKGITNMRDGKLRAITYNNLDLAFVVRVDGEIINIKGNVVGDSTINEPS